MNLLSLYDKLESLAHKLPQSLQAPILREIRPLKTLFLEQRPARLLLLGDRAASRSSLLNTLYGASVSQSAEDFLQDGTWQTFHHIGSLKVLDARRPAAISMLRRALTAEVPDLVLFLHTEPRHAADLTEDLAHAREVLQAVREKYPDAEIKSVGVEVGAVGGNLDAGRRALSQALSSQELPNVKLAGVYALGGGAAEVSQFASTLAEEVGEGAQLSIVRLAGLKDMQRKMAETVVKSVSAITGAVGAQPIPLADFPILSALQAGMVAGIMHISGRELSTKMAGEWLGALGANLGAGLVLREGARAVLKIVPVWGDLVAGGIAAAGTYGIGKAAIAYFIDGVTLRDAKAAMKKKARPSQQLPG